MNKLTYKEFERETNEMGYVIEMGKSDVIVKGDGDRTITTISHKLSYVLDLDWHFYHKMFQWDREKLANLSWRLASTPLEDREEPKYYLKVNMRIMPGAPEAESYLCVKRDRSRWMILDKFENEYYQTKFTDEEIKGLEKVLDLELFEKVEAEDE